MADPDEDRARQSVIDAGHDLERTGLSPQQSGNVSIRFREGITDSPTAYATFGSDDEEMRRVAEKFGAYGQAGAARPDWRISAKKAALRPGGGSSKLIMLSIKPAG
jgi:hypothetical protein